MPSSTLELAAIPSGGRRSMLSIQPANPAKVKEWRYWAFGSAGASGLLTVVNGIHRIFPAERLQNFADYESFIYAAFAIAFISGLFLLATNKVIAVSFAQVGAMLSLLYIGYSVVGIFVKAFMPVYYVIMVLGVVVIIVIFGESIGFLRKYGTTGDVALGLLFLTGAIFGGTYPLFSTLLPLLRRS